jgi:hypothetical protein
MGSPLSILDYRQPVEFRIGDVVIRAWNVLSRHFLTFVLLVGIAELLPLVLSLYIGTTDPQQALADPLRTFLLGAGLGILTYVLSTFAHAIVVFAAFQDLRGRPVNAGESLSQGVARVVPVLVASLLTGLLVGLGCLLCLVPGLIAMTAMAVVVPACVVERLGPIESMSRSADLTTGHRWPILAVAVAWAVVVIVISLTIQAAMPITAALPRQLATWIWQVISGSFTAVYAAILYHDLRAVREGIGIDEIASVFD